ncbi:MAG: hypothetical protein F4Z14_06805 [Gammaproteobacteria bacterium]|nr:hypothetical protein [Gammaproteobacteria bacterium]
MCIFIIGSLIVGEAFPIVEQAFFSFVVGTERPKPQDLSTSANEEIDVVPTNLSNLLEEHKSLYEMSVFVRRVLDSKSEDQLWDLWNRIHEIDDSRIRSVVNQNFVSRFATTSPQKTLNKILSISETQREVLLKTFFGALADENFRDSLSFLSFLNEKDERIALQTILIAHAELSEDQQLEIARQYGHSAVVFDVYRYHLLSLAELNSKAAMTTVAGDLLSNRTHPGMLDLFETIMKYWIDLYGTEAIAQIRSLPAETKYLGLQIGLLHYAQTDPRLAVELAQEQSGQFSDFLLTEVFRTWGASEPVSALEFLTKSDKLNSNFQLFEVLTISWAQHDPQGLLEQMPNLPEALHARATLRALKSLAVESPEEVVLLLDQVNTESKLHVARTIVEYWAQSDLDQTLSWIDSEFSGSDRHSLIRVVLLNIATTSPERAIKLARTEPTGFFEPGLEFEVIDQLARTDVKQAKAMLPFVRDGVTKLSSFGVVGFALVRRQEISEAFALGVELPEKMRDSYNGGLVGDWSIHDAWGLYQAIDTLPTEKSKSRAAVWLLGSHRDSELFSDEEIIHIRSFLSEADTRAVNFQSP